MMDAPCKDCPDRHALCHSTCEKYQAFVREREAIREQKKLESRTNTCFTPGLESMRREQKIKKIRGWKK
jgi:predicted metal-binding transcription factor (methanogenesis marker protein 9)